MVMENNLLSWLQTWYGARAVDCWEHRYGIRISTLDNPGWSVTADLRETGLEDRPFEAVNVERGERDWVYCWVEEGRFEGRGGPHNLADLLEVFRTWAGA
jgi:hypothetical protein